MTYRLFKRCKNVKLSLVYNGHTSLWVACAGGTETEDDRDLWFGKITGSFLNDDGSQWFKIIWLERTGKEIQGRYYRLCKDNSTTDIPADSIIVYGVEVGIHLHRKTHERVLRIKTPISLINKIWNSKNKDIVFNDLVQDVKNNDNVELDTLDGIRRMTARKHRYASIEDNALYVYDAVMNKK